MVWDDQRASRQTMSAENPAYDARSWPLAVPSELGALQAVVGEKTAKLCARYYGRSLRAVVLTGSLARDEATWVRQPAGWKLLGDAEFLLVFEAGAALPPQPAIGLLTDELQGLLRRDGILGRVQLTPAWPEYFTRLEPDIFAYELRACGRVVWGERDVLSLIPSFTPAHIPLEDAWRLLANRMIELLEAVAAIEACTGCIPERVLYCTVKLYLDMATSLLLFAGSYAPTYRERERRVKMLSASARWNGGWPFPLERFAERISVTTALKLDGEWRESAALGWDFWRQGLQYARLLWDWELARLVKGPPAEPSLQMMRSWMGRQPIARRLRGWMFVWRADGWLRSWRRWPRWARLALGGSPRCRVYSAAYGLFCQLPEVLDAGDNKDLPGPLVDELSNALPVLRGHWRTGSPVPWAWWVNEVTWNYHRFLEPTRA